MDMPKRAGGSGPDRSKRASDPEPLDCRVNVSVMPGTRHFLPTRKTESNQAKPSLSRRSQVKVGQSQSNRVKPRQSIFRFPSPAQVFPCPCYMLWLSPPNAQPIAVHRCTIHQFGHAIRDWRQTSSDRSVLSDRSDRFPQSAPSSVASAKEKIRNLPRQSEATAGPQFQLFPLNSLNSTWFHFQHPNLGDMVCF
jgi:hypothetical protein